MSILPSHGDAAKAHVGLQSLGAAAMVTGAMATPHAQLLRAQVGCMSLG